MRSQRCDGVLYVPPKRPHTRKMRAYTRDAYRSRVHKSGKKIRFRTHTECARKHNSRADSGRKRGKFSQIKTPGFPGLYTHARWQSIQTCKLLKMRWLEIARQETKPCFLTRTFFTIGCRFRVFDHTATRMLNRQGARIDVAWRSAPTKNSLCVVWRGIRGFSRQRNCPVTALLGTLLICPCRWMLTVYIHGM
jgi:hypothetical protein